MSTLKTFTHCSHSRHITVRKALYHVIMKEGVNMSISTIKRDEKKYMLSEAQYRELNRALSEHMVCDANCRDGAMYTIYNVYYDTDNDEIIQKSLSKPYYKEKLRMRSYDIPKTGDDKVYLELKKKIGGIVSKRRVAMTCSEAEAFVEKGIRPQNQDYISRQVTGEIEFFLKNHRVSPKVFIAYQRNAYFDRDDSSFRITFDSSIRTRRTSPQLKFGDFGQLLLSEGTYLMEVKTSGALPLWLTAEFSRLGIRSQSFSKYGTEYKRRISYIKKENCSNKKENYNKEEGRIIC